MIILGLDPGTNRIGYGLLKKADPPAIVDYGCLLIPSETKTSEQLKMLYSELDKLIKKHKPRAAAVEDIFFFKNTKTAIKVAQARGVIILLLAHNKIPVFEYTPLQIKQAVTGDGRADKPQMQKMIQLIFGLKKLPQPDDAADALAAALCLAHSERV